MITMYAPCVNLVTATTIRTMKVATAPTPFRIALRLYPGGFKRRHRRTIPVCESVKLVKTPSTYSWMSFVTFAS